MPVNSSAGHNGPKLVLSTSLAHIFSQSLVSPLCAPQLQQWELFITLLQPLDFCKYEPRNQKHGTLMLLLNRPLPKYYEKIPRTCLIAEVRHEMGSPFRYRYLPPTNRHIMQLYICEHNMGFEIMRWDRCIRNVWRFSFSLKRWSLNCSEKFLTTWALKGRSQLEFWQLLPVETSSWLIKDWLPRILMNHVVVKKSCCGIAFDIL